MIELCKRTYAAVPQEDRKDFFIRILAISVNFTADARDKLFASESALLCCSFERGTELVLYKTR